jgi:tryptophan 2,3-dioxygenase
VGEEQSRNPAAGGADASVSYGSYLKVPELLSLQRPLASPSQHDEMLFIVIHQVYELWFRLMIHEVGALREAGLAGNVRKCWRFYRRLIEIQRVLLQQISILETMTPADFCRFRDNLNPASGFQSLQFRVLEFLSGMKDRSSLQHLDISPAEREDLEERLAKPDLREVLDVLLRKEGFEIPEPAARPGSGEEDPASPSRVEALRRFYNEPDAHYDLYNLCEAMIEFDENFMLWRRHHLLMVERMIGRKMGTGGTAGVSYLETTLKKRCFPDLWEVRTHIGGASY